MKPNDEIEINAFIDGELSADQQAELLEAMQNDPEIARRACELGQLKAQLRLSYATPPQPRQRQTQKGRGIWPAVAASVALLGVGIAAGWLLHANALQLHGEVNRFALLDPRGLGQAPATADDADTRIVFHLTNADQTVAGELLDEVESMLLAYQSDQQPLRVEVVSHSDGLDLLRESLTHHKERIHQLAGRFPNLTFVACKNTIDRLRVEQGIEVRLIPDAEVIDSGVNHVVKRQKEGWSYIRA
jgi:intracellular sulfur oxidation DsrE/DsrF family protein